MAVPAEGRASTVQLRGREVPGEPRGEEGRRARAVVFGLLGPGDAPPGPKYASGVVVAGSLGLVRRRDVQQI